MVDYITFRSGGWQVCLNMSTSNFFKVISKNEIKLIMVENNCEVGVGSYVTSNKAVMMLLEKCYDIKMVKLPGIFFIESIPCS